MPPISLKSYSAEKKAAEIQPMELLKVDLMGKVKNGTRKYYRLSIAH